MRDFIFIFFGIFILNSASAQEITFFKVRGEKVKFYNYPSLRLTVSLPCKNAEKNKLCSELSFLNTITLIKIKSGAGSQNPGSLICNKLLQGKVYIGIDQNNNENSFCRIKDDLYIDSGTLTYYADKNDGYVQKSRNSKTQSSDK